MVTTQDVWNEMKDGLARFLRSRVRDEHDAADLLQEVFVRIHDGLPTLSDEARLGPWVRSVARNVLIDHLRARRPVEPAEDRASADDPPENHNAEVDRWLLEMLADLPAPYREAVEMAELQGRTGREVAERLGLSLSGAKSRVQRGRALLREKLLACCHLDFDRRGNVVGVEKRRACGCEQC